MDDLPPLRHAALPWGRIAYREAGSGPGLVLLHGLGGSSKSWVEQYRGLADGFRVIGWDAPGYGGSDTHPSPQPSADDFAAAVVGLIAALGLERVFLVGHSMGGIVAPRVALARPGLVERLVLSATKTTFVPDAALFEERRRELETLGPEEFGRRRSAGMLAPDAPEHVRRQAAAVAAEARLPGFTGAVNVLSTTDNTALLPGLGIPALVIAGATDRIADDAATRRLAETAGVERVVIEGSGHAAYVEQPERYNAALRSFFNGAADHP